MAVPEDIVSVLSGNGYVVLQNQLRIGGSRIAFDSILAADENDAALVLVVDASDGDLKRVRRTFRELSLALGRTMSRRPVAAVLLAPDPTHPILRELQDLCRTIIVGPNDEPQDALLPLLPLKIPEGHIADRSAIRELRHDLGKVMDDPLAIDLISAAKKSSATVSARAITEIADVISQTEQKK